MAVTNNAIRSVRLAYVKDAENALLMLRTEVSLDSYALFCSTDAVLNVLNALRTAIHTHHDAREDEA